MNTHSVLLIEDDDFVKNMLKQTFEREGYDVATASNGLEWLPRNGSFQVKVVDTSGVTKTTEVFVKIGVGGVADTTLDDLVASLQAIDNVSATLTADGRLQITAENGEILARAPRLLIC